MYHLLIPQPTCRLSTAREEYWERRSTTHRNSAILTALSDYCLIGQFPPTDRRRPHTPVPTPVGRLADTHLVDTLGSVRDPTGEASESKTTTIPFLTTTPDDQHTPTDGSSSPIAEHNFIRQVVGFILERRARAQSLSQDDRTTDSPSMNEGPRRTLRSEGAEIPSIPLPPSRKPPVRKSKIPVPSSSLSGNLPGAFGELSFVAESERRRAQAQEEEPSQPPLPTEEQAMPSTEGVDEATTEKMDQAEVARNLGLDELSGDEEEQSPKSTADKLYEEYLKGNSRSVSLNSEVYLLDKKAHLSRQDIIDHGVADNDSSRPRFSLRPPLVKTIERVFKDLQSLLAELAAEVPVRRALNNYHYLLDPYGDLLPVLRGASSLAELVGAWDILRERMNRGSRFVRRYVREARGEVTPASPASTASEVYRSFNPEATAAWRIREFRAKVPHHILSDDKTPRLDLLSPEVPLDAIVPVPEDVEASFPQREAEANPAAFSYAEDGTREDLTFLSRTSYYAGFGSSASEPESISGAVARRPRSRGPRNKAVFADQPEYADPAGDFNSPQATSTAIALQGNYHGERTAPDNANYASTPSARNLPNVQSSNFLYGLASASTTPRFPPPTYDMNTVPGNWNAPLNVWRNVNPLSYPQPGTTSAPAPSPSTWFRPPPGMTDPRPATMTYQSGQNTQSSATYSGNGSNNDPPRGGPPNGRPPDRSSPGSGDGASRGGPSGPPGGGPSRPPGGNGPPGGGPPGGGWPYGGGRPQGGGPPGGGPPGGGPPGGGPPGPPGGGWPPGPPGGGWPLGPPGGGPPGPPGPPGGGPPGPPGGYPGGGWIPQANGNWDPQFNMPTALVPQIKPGSSIGDAIPEWDGRGTTALQWFADVQEFAGVRELMKAAPVAWKNILSSDQVASVNELQVRVFEMEPQLVAAAATTNYAISRDSIVRVLRDLGVDTRQMRSNNRTAHYLLAEEPSTDDSPSLEEVYESEVVDAPPSRLSRKSEASAVSPSTTRVGFRKTTVEDVDDDDADDDEYLARQASANSAHGLAPEMLVEREETKPTSLVTEPFPTSVEEISWVRPRRYRPSGTSALGVSVLSMRGRVNSLDEKEIDLRLDSGADITLLSAEYYRSLAKPPKLRQGRKMQLWQLTDQAAQIEGYVELPLFVTTQSGETLGLHAEAYVVPGMNVPLLLGEDFHVAYELNVQRHVEFGTTITFGSDGGTVTAQGVRRTAIPRMIEDTSRLASFVRAKLHRRNKARRRARVLASERDANVLRVSQDVRLPPNTCVNVPVTGYLEEADEWLVEKSMIGDSRVAPLVIPNVLISRVDPRVPVTNTTNAPRTLRKGEILASISKPSEYFDKPKNLRHLTEMIQGLLERQTASFWQRRTAHVSR
ncbi:hypothetical protein BC629DRAFT_1444896 [Irpex lacteus]|nr:hypothetical protein BC629DRAFT_1444896 [Irpex lacteus]